MEELKLKSKMDNILELRCRDNCPCGYMDTNNSKILAPENFK